MPFALMTTIAALCLVGASGVGTLNSDAATIGATEYESIQQALDANPGRMLFLSSGTYHVSEPLRIQTPDSGLYGPATIVQTNPDANILEVAGVAGVRVEGLTLTRPEGKMETSRHAIHAVDCDGLDLSGVRVRDNRSTAGTIFLERCRRSRVSGCTVLNYKRIGVDDRTENDLYGYAFRVIDGTGILVTYSEGIRIQDNQVIEKNLFPTLETKQRYGLGRFTEGKKPLRKGQLAPPGDYANNWHQGSAIVVTSPEATDHVLITGNYIENAAQGIDIHADHVTCSQNSIRYAFIGIKCMHGSRNVIISGNNVSHNDLWGLVMMPGTLSHPARPARDDVPAQGPNFTSGNIIANNVFSDFGFGYEYYNWEKANGAAISLESGQLATNPVMTDVLIQGNIVYDAGKDQVLVEGVPTTVPPRYRYAVYISPDPRPQGLHFSNNIFHPGRDGSSNIELTP